MGFKAYCTEQERLYGSLIVEFAVGLRKSYEAIPPAQLCSVLDSRLQFANSVDAKCSASTDDEVLVAFAVVSKVMEPNCAFIRQSRDSLAGNEPVDFEKLALAVAQMELGFRPFTTYLVDEPPSAD